MKENEAQSPTSVLFGWKEADKDIKEKNIDPSMGKPSLHATPASAETEAVAKAASEVPAAVPAEKGAAENKATH